jgi:hypothetical protein
MLQDLNADKLTIIRRLADIYLMKACYFHPWQTNDSQSRLERAVGETRWAVLRSEARRYLRRVKRGSKKTNTGPRVREEVDRLLIDLESFSPANPFNAKNPEDFVNYVYGDSVTDIEKLNRLKELFEQRHVLPLRCFYPRLFVAHLCLRDGVQLRFDSLYGWQNSVVAKKLMEAGLEFQKEAHEHVQCALGSCEFYEYVRHLFLAGPYFRAAKIALEEARDQFSTNGDAEGERNAETERYVSEEWYANCATAIKLFGTSILRMPFVHLEVMKVMHKYHSNNRTINDLISYLMLNDVIFPAFCKRAWEDLLSEVGREVLALPTQDVDRTEALLLKLEKRYLGCVVRHLDNVSAAVLERCFKTWNLHEKLGIL